MKILDKKEAKKMEVFVRNEEAILRTNEHLLNATKKACMNNYGHVADPNLPTWKNIENALCLQTPDEYFNRPARMAYHNLCTKLPSPKGIGTTLGLGLKFCVQSDRAPHSLTKSFERFEKDSHINTLCANRDFVILNADKNLGPVIIEREEYIKNVLNEHLLDEDTYEQIEEINALKIIDDTRDKTMELIIENKEYLTPEEFRYFTRSFTQNNRHPQFYSSPKVHKGKIPVPLRPVVSQCGSVFAVISIFIDFKLQHLTQSIPSYLKNSTSLLDELDKFGTLPPSAKLFTSDATSMYSNIDPEEALPVLEAYLNEFSDELKGIEEEQIKLLIKLTRLVMKNNVFQFGSTWWRQKIGTAMGTPCACIYATIFFAYFERKVLLPKYRNNIILYKRQIDDIFAIWKTDPNRPNAWEEFKNDLNSVCKLHWNTEELDDTTNFLDLTIWIDKDSRRILYKTYHKPMNLFLYIPSHSASPPGLLKSLVFGLLQTYKRQNARREDFQTNVKRLFHRLLARGYKKDQLSTVFNEAAEKLNNPKKRRDKINEISVGKNEDNQLFFHLTYHPRGVSRRFVQQKYKEICVRPNNLGESFCLTKNTTGGVMRIRKLTVAYSRPKNLRDLMSPSKLLEFNDCKVQKFL